MLDVDAVLDIETEDWEHFALGGLLDADGTYRSTRDPEQLVDWLLMRGGHVWTWNGGLFDTLWFAECVRKRGLKFQGTPAGPRVTRLECEGLVIRDAFALIPMALKKAARMAGIELDKETGLPCRCGEDCGGYCSIRRAMPRRDFETLDKYLRKDCEATLATLRAVIAEAERCGYLLAGTVGGSSFKTFSAIVELESAQWPDAQTYYFAREGYYGGRVEVFQPSARRGFSYDINSAYPAALTRVALPVGDFARYTGEKATRAFKRGKEGIYVARVHVPEDMHLPPLPVRTPGGRIVYPVGAITGTWTALELRGAIARGCATEIDRALVWGAAETVMAAALAIGWANRARAKSECATGQDDCKCGPCTLAAWHKWVCNSFTGKLAEAPEKERLIGNPDDDEVIRCECRSKRACRCNAWRPLDRDGQVWSAPFWRLSDCAHVHFAAYLTAWTRLTLLGQLEDDGQGGRSAVYCDTDSVKATAPRARDIGKELGQWGDEGGWTEGIDFDTGEVVPGFRALAPKLYRQWKGNEWFVRGKGLPGLDAAGFDAFARGEPWEISSGVMSFKQAAGKGGSLFAKKALTRRSHADGSHFGGRVLGPDGLTHPRSMAEIVAWEKSL